MVQAGARSRVPQVTAWEGLNPPYATIVADPPWPFVWSGGAGGKHRRSTPLRYTLMDLDGIKALPVGDLTALDAWLFLWVTREMFREGHGCAVARAWGFEPVTEIIWEKPNFGMGVFPRNCHEPVLIARRGAAPAAVSRSVRSVQRWAQVTDETGGKAHTAKPAGLGDLIESNFPGPYVELFARQPRLGWDHWGHGYEISA